jgi:hypothetical protein
LELEKIGDVTAWKWRLLKQKKKKMVVEALHTHIGMGRNKHCMCPERRFISRRGLEGYKGSYISFLYILVLLQFYNYRYLCATRVDGTMKLVMILIC